MDQVALGELTVSAQGLGCMGMSMFSRDTTWEESVATIHRALELGVTFFDTANAYGSGHNEVLIGRAVAERRDDIQLSTKLGIDRSAGVKNIRFRGSADYVQESCEASLLRLGFEHIDLYFLHRPPVDVEIEETVGAMADLVRQGKVRAIGLCEVDEAQLRRAQAVHPITAVQSEYSLWTRDHEALVPAMRELGVGLVPYSPLGRGFLTNALDVAALGPTDYRRADPRLADETVDANQRIVDRLADVAKRKGATPAQVALAWVHAQTERLGLPVVPIPGTKHVKWLEQNVGALAVELDADDLAELDGLQSQVVGARPRLQAQPK
jgi:aryl-alcohol dehydrogenase-like predicted oxidoreductase